MNAPATTVVTGSSSRSILAAGIFAAMVGAAIVFATGFVQADTLHDAAHDVRHATGFPCH
ncbi:CbtB domain-containing protein [Allosediminivita pacifica]|uniref:Cobalt transporter subunit CbtB n=1 Tax=Allosediminivita pacifica TaxID=1267769 RepID=A0A2T6ASB1_9RHOB|nr:CbtB domain-containing protein [Allosediminivita pacifica]PTX46705.1 cobalt transporter subunit CbtB [Allosediminivita pacifica]GGB16199.1 hypothetical protein GCM10011324_28050 [Allosediminivita pacifica]